MQGQEKMKVAAYVAVAFVLFFSVNVISSLAFNRYHIDMTEDKIFTLSKASEDVLEKSDEPITFKLFYSDKLTNGIPTVKAFYTRIRGMMEQYVQESGGKIKLEVIDPEPFSDEEDKAVSYGLKGVDIDQNGSKAYLGMVATNSVDNTKVIPLFAFEREKFLEYELTRMVYDLSNKKRKVVGVISSIEMGTGPMMGIPGFGGAPWFVVDQISQTFDMKKIEESAVEIPEGIDVLMVVQPKAISSEMMRSIEKYVLTGGKAIFFIDPNKEGAGSGNPADRSFSISFNTLLNSWGLNISNSEFIGDKVAARKYDNGAFADEKWKYVDYVGWLGLRDTNINDSDVVTSQLRTINLATPGNIEISKKEGIEVTPLLKSSDKSALIPVQKIREGFDPNKILLEFIPDGKEHVMAVRLSGKASAITGIDSKENINVIVVADTDILRDDTWAKAQDYQGYKVVVTNADNAAFIVNALDNLSGSSDLINLRGRGAISRPFTKVKEVTHEAEERYLSKEKELKDKLADTEKKLAQLQSAAKAQAGNELAFQVMQQQEIKRFSAEAVEIKKELRSVQLELRKSMEKLGSILKFINIWLMPIFITLFAMFFFFRKNNLIKK